MKDRVERYGNVMLKMRLAKAATMDQGSIEKDAVSDARRVGAIMDVKEEIDVPADRPGHCRVYQDINLSG